MAFSRLLHRRREKADLVLWFPTLAAKTNTRGPDLTQRVPRFPGALVGYPVFLLR
jgi:hypothetical protein